MDMDKDKPRFEPSMEILLDGRRGRIKRVADQALVVRFDGETFDRWIFRDNVELLWRQGKVRLGAKLGLLKCLLWRLGWIKQDDARRAA